MSAALNDQLRHIPLQFLRPDPQNPREPGFDVTDLLDTMGGDVGLLQPIVVRRDGNQYVIVAGHRRTRAAGLLGWPSIPAIIKADLPADDVLMAMLVENGNRRDLDPIAEGRAIRKFMWDKKIATYEEAARLLGRSKNTIADRIALLDLPEREQELVRAKDMSLKDAAHRSREITGRTIASPRASSQRGVPKKKATAAARSIGTTSGGDDYFGHDHQLAKAAAALCPHIKPSRWAACPSCWEKAIRQDAVRPRGVRR